MKKYQKYRISPSFPANIFCIKEYDGAKVLAMAVFLPALAYFCAFFLPREKSWWEFIPLIGYLTRTAFNYAGFIWRFTILASAFCLLWLTFDSISFSGYATGTFAVMFGMFYASAPFDLAPDFLPVIGQLDDSIIGILSIFLGFKNWHYAALQKQARKRIIRLLENGNRNDALLLLLEEKGINPE